MPMAHNLAMTNMPLGVRVQLIAGMLLVVTVVLLADPLRLWPNGPDAAEFLVGLLLTAALMLLGVRGVRWRNGGS